MVFDNIELNILLTLYYAEETILYLPRTEDVAKNKSILDEHFAR